MSLSRELGLIKPIQVLPHEVLLNVYHTASLLRKTACNFFKKYDLTDVQFNLMMLLKHQGSQTPTGGLTQSRISKMMLVNRANVTSLIDRMEKARLLERTPDPNDRRFHIIKLTDHGRALLEKVEPHYQKEVMTRMAPFQEQEQKTLITLLERIRHTMNARRSS